MILEMHEDCKIPISVFVTTAFPVAQAELQSILPNQAMLARAAWRYTESLDVQKRMDLENSEIPGAPAPPWVAARSCGALRPHRWSRRPGRRDL